jgi:hypothetical protein
MGIGYQTQHKTASAQTDDNKNKQCKMRVVSINLGVFQGDPFPDDNEIVPSVTKITRFGRSVVGV